MAQQKLAANSYPTSDSLINNQRKLVQDHKSSARWLQMILDFGLVVGLLYAHAWMRGAEFDTQYRALAILTVLLMAVVYHVSGLYRLSSSIYRRFIQLARSWMTVIALLVAIAFITKTSTQFSREVILTWTVSGFVAQFLAFLVVRYLQTQNRTEAIRTLIVGNGQLAQHLATHINENPWIPDHVIGLIATEAETSREIEVLGDLSEISSLVDQHDVHRVYLALPMQQAEWVKPLYIDLAQKQVDIIWAPDIFSVELLNHSVRELGGVPLISLSETPLIGSNAFLKSVLDYTVASCALIGLSPIMLITAFCIKVTSPGPVLFKQKRHGWNGEEINVYKFRSMKLHEETDGVVTQASKHDDRVTRVGRFIRKTSIDELPQLFNVLSGNMSIVGPRPHAIAHNLHYGDKIKDYMRRHRVKPGLTGLAQVNGFRGETQDIASMEGRVQYDLAYINNWSIWLDIKIIVKTAFVLFDKNAY